MTNHYTSRRQFIQYAMLGLGSMVVPTVNQAAQRTLIKQTVLDQTLNIEIPKGSVIRVIAQSNQAVIDGQSFKWHRAPDGGACFATNDGGWIYVSNSEIENQGGGASAIRFNQAGDIVDAYSILSNTSRNCAGGKTPWNTWLSCEENGEQGQIYECDPTGQKSAVLRAAMGSFNHEAAAVDPASGIVYLTEDVADGCLYRFKPNARNDLSEGVLEVAVPNGAFLAWKQITEFVAQTQILRYQIMEAARFRGGEGIIYHAGQIFFTTKYDNIVWRYDIATSLLFKVYSASDYQQPLLTGVDNIEVSQSGELLVAEDGGDLQIIALDHAYRPHVLVAVHGHNGSEITGPAFSPDGRRLYFSSQRGKLNQHEAGISYEVLLE